MAPKLSNLLFAASSLASLASCGVVTYDFDIGWTRANPDGQLERSVIGINGHWPLPSIEATKGDQVIVNVKNSLGNESTSLHFHGLYQNGTNEMDGPIDVTQCGIPPGSSFTYNFTVEQPGTFWYHSHERGQYPDGLRAPLVVHDPQAPFKFDEEVVLTVSDWYHDSIPSLLKTFISASNPDGAEPIPKSALINDTINPKIKVEAGKTYFFRIINVGAFASQYVWFEGHTMKIVEVDGIYTDPQDAEMIYVAAAQRYGVLITAKSDASANFAFVSSMDEGGFDSVPPGLNPNVTGWLLYDEAKPKTPAKLIDAFAPIDDFNLVPQDKEPLLDHVDQTITLELKMGDAADGANYAYLNNITYKAPDVPTLYSVLSSGPNATKPETYGTNVNPFVLAQNEVVEIILNNSDDGSHPMHLHGHTFQVVTRSAADAGPYDPAKAAKPLASPMRRDTVMVNANGHLVLRYRSDNPGVWIFHCHLEWHVASGLTMTTIEAPLAIQQQLNNKLPADHLHVCPKAKLPM